MTVIIASTTSPTNFNGTTIITRYVTVGQMNGTLNGQDATVLKNFGTILVDTGNAVVTSLNNMHVENYDEGLILAFGGTGIVLGAALSTSADNQGTIRGAYGIAVNGGASFYTITNSGRIITDQTAINVTPANEASGTITNSGLIQSSTGIHLSGTGIQPTITNSGTIETSQFAVEAYLGAAINLINTGMIDGYITGSSNGIHDSIVNSGTITRSISLGSGDDTVINTGTMGSYVDLEAGNDSYTGGGNGSVTGVIYGGAGNDTIIGGNVANTIDAGADNDSVRGGGGKDTMDGGTGTDTLDYTDKTKAVLITLDGAHPVDVKVGGVIEDSVKNFEWVLGGSAADKFVGDGLANRLEGRSGDDTLIGGGEADTLMGGAGKDSMDGGSGSDTADYSDRSQEIDVTLNGSTLVTVKVNGVAEDKIKNIENVIGGSGVNKLTGDGLDNYLSGKGGNDKLIGNGGNDTLDGGTGKDTMDGGAGNDLLISTHGNDVMTGGSGADEFRFSAPPNGSDQAVITDFVHGVDRIEADTAQTTPSQFLAYEFQSNASGHAAGGPLNFVIYDRSDGTLWFDADGNGGAAAMLVATLSNKPQDLAYTDLWFV